MIAITAQGEADAEEGQRAVDAHFDDGAQHLGIGLVLKVGELEHSEQFQADNLASQDRNKQSDVANNNEGTKHVMNLFLVLALTFAVVKQGDELGVGNIMN